MSNGGLWVDLSIHRRRAKVIREKLYLVGRHSRDLLAPMRRKDFGPRPWIRSPSSWLPFSSFDAMNTVHSGPDDISISVSVH